jgi:hypothetical protein
MATTALQIINRALRLANVVDAANASEATDTANALETLNALLAEWYESGIGLPQYSFAQVSSAITCSEADREAISYQLASRIAGEYGSELTPAQMSTANETMQRLRHRYFQPADISFNELPFPASATSASNIVTGS